MHLKTAWGNCSIISGSVCILYISITYCTTNVIAILIFNLTLLLNSNSISLKLNMYLWSNSILKIVHSLYDYIIKSYYLCFFYRYSRVHISSDTAFFKILKKPSIVQKSTLPHMNLLGVFHLEKTKKKFFWTNQ